MLRVLTILSSVHITCLYLTSSVLAQQSTNPLHCIEHHQHCYPMREIISINSNNYSSQTISTILYNTNNKQLTITFHTQFLNVREQPRITVLKLCHEEALHLTVNDLECDLTCTTEIFDDIQNSVSVRCEGDSTDVFFTGNRTIIAFRPNRTVQSCNNSSVNLVWVDTDGKSNFNLVTASVYY